MRGPSADVDDGVRHCVAVLERYVTDRPGACAEVYRHGRYSIRIRVVWDGFRRTPAGSRIIPFLDTVKALPDEVISDIALVVLVTPQELGRGHLNEEFDNPYTPELKPAGPQPSMSRTGA